MQHILYHYTQFEVEESCNVNYTFIMTVKKQLGKQIRKYRENLGLSQEEFSEMIDVSRNTISRIETGKHLPTAKNLDKIRKVVNIENSNIIKDEKLALIIDKLTQLQEKDLDLINNILDTLIQNSL